MRRQLIKSNFELLESIEYISRRTRRCRVLPEPVGLFAKEGRRRPPLASRDLISAPAHKFELFIASGEQTMYTEQQWRTFVYVEGGTVVPGMVVGASVAEGTMPKP